MPAKTQYVDQAHQEQSQYKASATLIATYCVLFGITMFQIDPCYQWMIFSILFNKWFSVSSVYRYCYCYRVFIFPQTRDIVDDMCFICCLLKMMICLNGIIILAVQY